MIATRHTQHKSRARHNYMEVVLLPIDHVVLSHDREQIQSNDPTGQ